MHNVRPRYTHVLRATVHKVLCRGSPHTQSQTPLLCIFSPCPCAACQHANAQPLQYPMSLRPSKLHQVLSKHVLAVVAQCTQKFSCVVRACS